jgi:cytochrome oxidase Cu insertion factor (SCO1/SenC/PrrC family)
MTLARREVGALGALAAIGTITAVWWALALWPLPGDAPDWLLRTRAVCFGSVRNGLPTTAGWMALIGQPVYMLATLWLISGHTVVRGLRALAALPAGRMTLGAVLTLTVLGLGAAGIRVGRAAGFDAAATASPRTGVVDAPRLHRPAPALALVDQRGSPITLSQFRGRPVFVTFAFAHCETVCPLVVRDLLQAQGQAAELAPVVVIVTLDPWRDPPARLSAIATQWQLGKDAHILSGGIADVERTLDAWQVGRTRDTRTGEVTHATVVYVLDRSGEIAFALSGVTDAGIFAALARRL